MTDLLRRLPNFLQEYGEMKEIANVQNPEFDIIWELEKWIRKQLYIHTAEEYGLSRYERMLGLTPLEGESLAERRNHILLRWNATIPYTMRFLYQLLETLFGQNFRIVEDFKNYRLDIIVFNISGARGVTNDLIYISKTIIPANLEIRLIPLLHNRIFLSPSARITTVSGRSTLENWIVGETPFLTTGDTIEIRLE